MKKIIKFTSVFLLLCLTALFSNCGKEYDEIPIGPDGYGKTTLANGMTVLVNRDETTSLTAARILIGGGILTENAQNNGITNLMTRMLLKGNIDMTAGEISQKLDFLGANVDVSCFTDYSAISFVSLTKYFDQVLEIITASLMTPAFPEEELTKLKHEVEGEIKSSNDNQSQSSSNLFWKTVYGDQVYGLPTLGTIESISNISIEEIKEHYRKYVGGNNMLFSVSTDLPANEISRIVTTRLSFIRADAENVPVPTLTLQSNKEGFISFDRNQSFIYMGFPMDHLLPEDVPYVILLNEVMGNNIGSRLWYLRQDEKLAYSVYTQYIINKYGAAFRGAIGTDTAKVDQALSSLSREWAKLISDGITAEELADAKMNMKNNLIYKIDKKSNRANNMAYYEYVGYNYKFVLDLLGMIDRITLAQVNNFIKEKLDEERKYVSIVGKK